MKNRLVSLLSSGTNAFVIHGNADPDALASAYLLKSVFSGAIIAPGGIDRTSKVVAETLSIEVLDDIVGDFDNIVILDTSGPEQLGHLRHLGNDPNAIVIDHHAHNTSWASKFYHCDDAKSSCSEVAYEIAKASGKGIPRDAALAILGGILTDSGHFRYGKAETLSTFARIMTEHDIPIREPLELIEGEMDLSERISQLRGAQRLRYIRVEKFIIATSFGSAFEASVSRSLVSLGADIAFVGSQRGEHFRISARAGSDVVEKGMHLGKLLEGIGKDTSNGGGGHSGAAGLSGRGDVRHMLDLCVNKSRKALRSLVQPK